MMHKAEGNAFLDRKEFDFFKMLLKQTLGKCLIKGSTAHLNFHDSGDENGSIFLYDKEDSQYFAAAIDFFHVKGILEYNIEAKDFFDVSDRFVLVEKGGGK